MKIKQVVFNGDFHITIHINVYHQAPKQADCKTAPTEAQAEPKAQGEKK